MSLPLLAHELYSTAVMDAVGLLYNNTQECLCTHFRVPLLFVQLLAICLALISRLRSGVCVRVEGGGMTPFHRIKMLSSPLGLFLPCLREYLSVNFISWWMFGNFLNPTHPLLIFNNDSIYFCTVNISISLYVSLSLVHYICSPWF